MSMDLLSVVCRSIVPTLELSVIALRTQSLYFDRPCGGGWWWGTYTDADLFDTVRLWLPEIERATGSPAMMALDLDSDCVDVIARTSDLTWWRVCLIRAEMQSYLDEEDLSVDDVFLAPKRAVDHAVRWAQAAGLDPDPEALGYLLGLDYPDPSIPDVFEQFLAALGLRPES
jgi:hypothetical protein